MFKKKIFSLKRITFKKNNYFILHLYYALLNIILIISSTSQSDKTTRKNNYLSEINLVIQGNGTQKILSDEFNL